MKLLNKNQRGFAPVETALILVIVALIAFVAWYVFHTKSNTDSTYGNAANTQTEPSNPKSSSQSKTSTTSDLVQTKTDSKLGQYLAAANGHALYTYSLDSANTSNCDSSCLKTWPAYKAASASANLPANVTTIKVSGGYQYEYKDMPLYYYVGDSAAGQINGNGLDNFSVAKP